MLNATTLTPAPAYMPPLPAEQAVLPTPELMAIVMRRVGKPVERRHFHAAPETCDLTDAQLDAHIGAAARIVEAGDTRQVFPQPPLHPWDADPSYRVELIRRGGRLVATGLADTAAIVAALDRGQIEPAAMIDLWDDIITEAIDQMHRQPRLSPLARIIADLEEALTAYDQPGNNAETRQLAQSMRSALDALRNNQQLPRHHVLRTADAFAAAMEWGSFPVPVTAKARTAVDLLRKLWGL